MAELVITPAFETLRDLVIKESKLLAGVGAKVEDVGRQLNRMHCFLKDADKRKDRLNSETIQQWLRELRDLAIEAEQLLEIYATEVMSKREANDLMSLIKRFGCILCECATMHQTRNKAQHIISRMSELTTRLDSMATGEGSTDVVEWSRKTYGHEVEENFVGMKDELQHLTSLVTSDERPHKVISICGMGGLGKTTLARKIYQANKVQRHFDAKAWITVSQTFRPAVIFQELLKQLLHKEKLEDLSEDELVRQLYNIQKEKKCLVVLDDVRETDHWNILSRGFPIAESSSKVLITSRNEKVAATEHVYKLKQLSEDEGWELLQKIAPPDILSQVPSTTDLQKIEDLGRKMVRKCGFLPLAISVTGGILRQETDLRGWEKVCKNLELYVRQGQGMDNDMSVAQVLDLSYYALPYHLKPCFLYLAAFGEDEEIDVDQVYLIWMAEGLISFDEKGQGETLRDVAERYLCELASRCMIQVTLDGKSRYGRYSSCRLHDLVRELSLYKAKEERFLSVTENGRSSSSSMIEPHRRVVVNHQVGDPINYRPTNPNLRALMILQHDFKLSSRRDLIKNLGSLKYLKILVLENLRFKNGKLPKGIINKMVLLKHLRINRCNLKTLPRAIRKLRYLQSLYIDGWPIFSTPNVVHKMSHLTYIHLPVIARARGCRKLKLHGLNELETLVGFDSATHSVTDLIRLEKLQVLHAKVWDVKSLRNIVDHIFSQHDQFNDVVLEVAFDINSNEGLDLLNKILLLKPLSALSILKPALIPDITPEFGRNLVNLALVGCKIVKDNMERLGRLPVLRKLVLVGGVFVGTEMIFKAGGFPQLKHLELRYMDDLVDLKVEDEAMPNLSSLIIYNCVKLMMVPDGLKFIASLQELIIMEMPKEFQDRIAQGGADYEKIKHVPSIQIYDVWTEINLTKSFRGMLGRQVLHDILRFEI